MKSENVKIAINGRTDIGQVRDENEDSIGWFVHPEYPFGYIVVADGMGGYTGGATASRLAVTILETELNQMITPEFLTCTVDQQELMLRVRLLEAINSANQQILNAKEQNPDFEQMGTTLVVALVWQRQVIVAHLGDSRAYTWNKSGLVQVTKDHSVVQEMIDEGSLTEEEARSSNIRNHITRALGVVNTVSPSITTFEVEHDCLLMLCSDGLTEYMDNPSLEHVLATHRPSLECCYRLIDDANKSGGKDNISVGIIELGHIDFSEMSFGNPAPVIAAEDITIRKDRGVSPG